MCKPLRFSASIRRNSVALFSRSKLYTQSAQDGESISERRSMTESGSIENATVHINEKRKNHLRQASCCNDP